MVNDKIYIINCIKTLRRYIQGRTQRRVGKQAKPQPQNNRQFL